MTADGTGMGFRLAQRTLGLSSQETVGRTSSVSGQVVMEHGRVKAADFNGDLASMSTGSTRGDQFVRTEVTGNGAFPTASFRLDEPVDVPSGAAVASMWAHGNLSLKGQTKPFTVQFDAQLVPNAFGGSDCEVIGHVVVSPKEFGITLPGTAGLVSFDDTVTFEMRLILRRVN